jgi:hypothetical protein
MRVCNVGEQASERASVLGRSGSNRKGSAVETTVAYECQAPAHRSVEGGGPDKLTVHEGAWAFCPYDSKAEGHEWKPTGGLTLTMLRNAAALRERDRMR